MFAKGRGGTHEKWVAGLTLQLDIAKQLIAELTVERDNLDALCTIARESMAAAFKRADEAHQAGFLACQKAAVECVLNHGYLLTIRDTKTGPSTRDREVCKEVRDQAAQAISELKPEGQ
jgi:hypothetical protein